MTYQEVLDNARQSIKAVCLVCPECNGRACRGQVPGMGGIGSGIGFTGSVDYLARVRLNMDTLCPDEARDTTLSLFGKSFKYPFFAAPIGGMGLNFKAAT